MIEPAFTRRRFLATAVLLPLAGCADGRAGPPPKIVPGEDRLVELERWYGARLGMYALATGTGATIEYRADERFAFCSAFKGLAAAAVLRRNPPSHLDTLVRYTRADLLRNAAITPRHVDTGMTVRQLCDAAVRYSDGTAGNLLLRDLGGPAQLTTYARSLGDRVTRMDRFEPFITEATPGDPRDTSTPRAFGADYRRIVLGDALTPEQREFLRDLMERNATAAGTRRIRAGLPKGWRVADKTGTGDYGTVNDFAVVWPPHTPPLIISIMTSKPARDAPYSEAIVAEAAAHAVATLAG